ncbi:hypothetical protein [Serratia sp. SCBI]|uniref:hypothetical protein n=1 Tax=Serratia sp. SCBI TaxID=488142 RepID=UPI000ADAEE18|nr:hypothetical protein [Serratia sp. SCBI]
MSMTESKAPTKGKTTRPAKTTKKSALSEKIEAALAKAVRKTATLGQLVLTDLNVRKKKILAGIDRGAGRRHPFSRSADESGRVRDGGWPLRRCRR